METPPVEALHHMPEEESRMEYYLIRLSYTAPAWAELVEKTKTLDDRLESVRQLIKQLGGAFATFHFFDDAYFDDAAKRQVVMHKFVPFGNHDIVTIVAMPDRATARAFNMAIAAEDGVKTIEMTPMITMEDAIGAMAAAKSARARARYAAPGRAASGRAASGRAAPKRTAPGRAGRRGRS
jgi:uncharacterized protein with GYD domain